MSLSNRVEDLARAVVCLDTTDLPALVRLQDELTELAASIGGTDPRVLSLACRHAAEAVETIVLRSTEDAEATLVEVRQTIEYAQLVVDAAMTGLEPSSVRAPGFLGVCEAGEAGFDRELLSAWVSSCSSALSELESAVISLDAGDQDVGQDAEARRIIHTIKGEAGILSLGDIQTVCHDCESLIDLSKDGGGRFPVEATLGIVDWVRSCITVLSEGPTAALPPHAALHESIREAMRAFEPGAALGDGPGEGGASEPAFGASAVPCPAAPTPGAAPAFDGPDGPVQFPPEAVIDETSAEFVCEAREHIANAEQSLLDLESDLHNLELINTVFRAFHTIKGVAGFMSLTPIVRLTHVAESLLDQARSGKLNLTAGHLDLFLRVCDVLGQLIGAIQGATPPLRSVFEAVMGDLHRAGETGACPAPTHAPRASGPAPLATPVAAPALRASPEPGADLADAAAPDDRGAPGAAADTTAEVKPGAATAREKSPAKGPGRIEQSVKVSTTRMDALVDMVGELVIGYQMVYQDETIQGIRQQHTQRTLGHVSKIIRDLQEVAMSLRLVTLRSTFQKMARLVRDVSSKSGKNIRFHVEGEDVELDRNVVEEISDPLVHMIRNACDHGIEPADERRAAGKAPEGNVTLRAYHQGGSIVVEVADDGRGLKRERIIEKAISKGIYAPDRDHSEIPDVEVFNLVFAPGFSTAETVTDISGRGVGMDVVRRNIEALRGKVEIDSDPGLGSAFRMRLPLTMAIIDGMIVSVGSQRYVIPTLSIEQSFRPAPGTVHTAVGKGEMAMVRGELLPVYRAREVLGLDTGADTFDQGLLLILESHETRFCLLVDEIVGQQQVVIKTLGRGVAPIKGVSGGAILGDGRVALILDVRGIVSRATAAA